MEPSDISIDASRIEIGAASLHAIQVLPVLGFGEYSRTVRKGKRVAGMDTECLGAGKCISSPVAIDILKRQGDMR